MNDLSNIDYNNCEGDDWKKVIKAMDSGEKVKIHESIYYYFLEVLPPIKMFNGGFLFAEGSEGLRRFTNVGKDYFVQNTEKINPVPMMNDGQIKAWQEAGSPI